MAALECLKDNVMILRVLRLIKIILILSNLKIRMDGIITKIEEFAFSRYTFCNSCLLYTSETLHVNIHSTRVADVFITPDVV